ncbi:fatty acid cis/trans isomerase [Microbulbifer magnicolonia]|uniref:fatty acid cis/trans isomerase n=1 Tax=Microbulbifer magnicolonia TaxID=3109744 RepID=UPI002B408F95|nr:fatty acid cis/trans isomerase [Microbulbifer sp. GG15]
MVIHRYFLLKIAVALRFLQIAYAVADSAYTVRVKSRATSQSVYNPSRLAANATARLFIDGKSVADWRNLGFLDVITAGIHQGKGSQKNNNVKQTKFSSGKRLPDDFPLDINRELSCATTSEVDQFFESQPVSGRPMVWHHGLTGLKAINGATQRCGC